MNGNFSKWPEALYSAEIGYEAIKGDETNSGNTAF